jgi:hypothetical protein
VDSKVPPSPQIEAGQTVLVLDSVDAGLDMEVSEKINYQPHYRTLTDAGK